VEHKTRVGSHTNVQLDLFSLHSPPNPVGFGLEGERRKAVMLNRKSRTRIHGMLADVVSLELWLVEELGDDEVTHAELEDAFCRVQARMLVIQSILWPSDEEDFDADGSEADVASSGENPYG